MSTLFGPQDEPKPIKKRKRDKAEAPTPEERRLFVPTGAAIPFSSEILGRMDDSAKCPDDRCRAKCHDIVWKGRSQWRIECCFCGTGQMVDAPEEPVVEEPEVEVAEEFRFPVDSRREFVGLTVPEAASAPGGMPYIKWASQKSASPTVRAACKAFLDSKSPTR